MVETRLRPHNPAAYWDRRYRDGRTSGEGSEGAAAKGKAAWLDRMIAELGIDSVLDLGVGDGVVLDHVQAATPWLGVDVSPTVVDMLTFRYPQPATRTFCLLGDLPADATADATLSSDVLFHLIDDADYDAHLALLFSRARRYVFVHANDHNGGRTARHVLWRRWTPDVTGRFPDFELIDGPIEETRSRPGWFVYRRSEVPA